MSYQVTFKRSAERELARLREPQRSRVLAAIGGLRTNPRPHGSIKLKGATNVHRIRVGDHRVLYVIEDEVRIVTIEHVGDRKDVYR
ncbi:MAG: type II toxin-antitoxin system RelE/ParE family toxin [Flavobacteriales bacterium]|nr:type II toxin-antitoxin system RelE/ParE family toxin [Flavobacteriales bacterium]